MATSDDYLRVVQAAQKDHWKQHMLKLQTERSQMMNVLAGASTNSAAVNTLAGASTNSAAVNMLAGSPPAFHGAEWAAEQNTQDTSVPAWGTLAASHYEPYFAYLKRSLVKLIPEGIDAPVSFTMIRRNLTSIMPNSGDHTCMLLMYHSETEDIILTTIRINLEEMSTTITQIEELDKTTANLASKMREMIVNTFNSLEKIFNTTGTEIDQLLKALIPLSEEEIEDIRVKIKLLGEK